jgi:hypothetical protein
MGDSLKWTLHKRMHCHEKRCPVSLVMKEMQTKITTPIQEELKLKILAIATVGKVVSN